MDLYFSTVFKYLDTYLVPAVKEMLGRLWTPTNRRGGEKAGAGAVLRAQETYMDQVLYISRYILK